MSSHTMISWRPQNVIRRLPWQLDSKAALGVLLILAIFSLVGWLYLTQASAVTTTTYQIDELRLELDHLRNQNAVLTLEIAQLESLANIEQRAWQLGLKPTTNVRYLPVSNYPVSVEKKLSATHPAQLERDEFTQLTTLKANWWVAILDTVTAWLASK